MNFKAKLHKLIDGAYYVGIVEDAYDVISNPKQHTSLDIHWIKLGLHKNTWFADPFILKAEEKTITIACGGIRICYRQRYLKRITD